MATGRPDWFGTIVSAGKYNTTYVPIAVDVDGNLVSLMQGTYDSVLKTIAVDVDGVMLANLSAQDLDFLTVRPAYGQARLESNTTMCPTGVNTRIGYKAGQGCLYSTLISWSGSATRKAVSISVLCDGSSLEDQTIEQLMDLGLYAQSNHIEFPIKYDDTNFSYVMGVKPGLTFESSIEFKALQSYGSDVEVTCKFVYALTP